MNTLKKGKISSSDPIDRLIFEKGLRIKYVMPIKDLDLLLVVLNNRTVLKANISDYERLKKAKKEQLNKWELTGGGIGVHWSELDEDLSAKGFIKNALERDLIHRLEKKDDIRGVIV